MSQVVALSGQGPSEAQGLVYITYDQQQLETGFLGTGQYDYVPGFFFMGNVVYKKDSQGNMVAAMQSKDGTYPI